MTLTMRQTQLLCFIAGYQEARRGVSPTLTSMMVATGATSKGRVHALLTSLERAGLLHRAKHRQQWIGILEGVPVPRAPDHAPLYFVTVP